MSRDSQSHPDEASQAANRGAAAARRRTKWGTALVIAGSCAAYGLLADVILRRFLHLYAGASLWGAAYLTLAIWWLVATVRWSPTRVEERDLRPDDFSRRMWRAVALGLRSAIGPVSTAMVIAALLQRYVNGPAAYAIAVVAVGLLLGYVRRGAA